MNEANIKRTRKAVNGFSRVACVCGSVRLEVSLAHRERMADDDDDADDPHRDFVEVDDWLLVRCKRCGKTLYYNGA